MNVEQSSLGRIVIPDSLPAGKALFYTTRDFDGRLTTESARTICELLRDRFHIDASLSTCTQVHGADVRPVRLLPAARGEGGRRPDEGPYRDCDTCDALYTTEQHTALGIKVADCLPVTIIDAHHDVIANIHSGWRGTVQGITVVTLDTIARETRFEPQTSLAYLGPTIRVCCFEVGEEVAAQFDARFVDRSYAKPHVDVVAHTTALLRDRGFAADHIIDTELCTRCEGSMFHSFRRDGRGGGRNLAIAAQ